MATRALRGGAGGFTILAAFACGSGGAASNGAFDAGPVEPPGPCTVHATADRLCEGDGSPVDAGVTDAPNEASADGGDAATDAATGGLVAPPESENRCLVASDVTIECPSAVSGLSLARGAEGAREVLVAQRGAGGITAQGFLRNDPRAFVQHLHVDSAGGSVVTLDPVPPFEPGVPAGMAVGVLAGAASPSPSLVVHEARDGAGAIRVATLRPGDAPVFGPTLGGVHAPVGSVLSPFASLSGEGFLVLRKDFGDAAPLQLVRGLPGAPRLVETTVSSSAFAVTVDPGGEPAGLFRTTDALKLLEGETFANERWSRSYENGVNLPLFDLAYADQGGTFVPVIVSRQGDTSPTLVQLLRSGQSDPPSATLGESFSTCPRSTYVGVTCDACPVGRTCQAGKDEIGQVRLFTQGARVFATFVATDVRRTLGYEREVSPIGLGCLCVLSERSREEFADSLVVVEIVDQPPPAAPLVVERMRLPIAAARRAGLVLMAHGSDGEIDVAYGPPLASYEAAVTATTGGWTYRLLHLSTKSVP